VNMTFDQLDEELQATIITLNDQVWKTNLKQSIINNWLTNFSDDEKENALLLLSNFIYYNNNDIRNLCRYLYLRFRKHLILDLKLTGAKLDTWQSIFSNYKAVLSKTRFIALGDASESGFHMLYNFRKVNHLPVELFSQLYMLEEALEKGDSIDHIVFVDDLIGSGKQTVDFWEYLSSRKSEILKVRNIHYLALFGTESGIRHIENKTNIMVDVIEMFDSSHQVFSNSSMAITANSTRKKCRAMCFKYGKRLFRSHPLGYNNSQLLIGFEHNIPNNTLPIIWSNKKWNPLFERDTKIEKLSQFNENEFGE